MYVAVTPIDNETLLSLREMGVGDNIRTQAPILTWERVMDASLSLDWEVLPSAGYLHVEAGKDRPIVRCGRGASEVPNSLLEDPDEELLMNSAPIAAACLWNTYPLNEGLAMMSVSKRISNLIEDLSAQGLTVLVEDARDYLDHGEWGLAAQMLVEGVVEQGLTVRAKSADELREICSSMNMDLRCLDSIKVVDA